VGEGVGGEERGYCIVGNFRGVQISFLSFSVYQNKKFNTRNIHYDGCVLVFVNGQNEIKNTNQLHGDSTE